MEQKNVKGLVNEKATRYDIPRHCEEGKLSAARRGNLLSGLLRHFVPRNDECYYAKPNMESGLPPHLTHSRRCVAFTLAEVLITLGVIGIVAAMTIPNLVQNYKKQMLVTKAKWFYSFMSQAIQRSEVDNGSLSNWSLVGDNSVEYFNKYIKNYIRYTDIKECLTTTSDTSENRFDNYCIYLANGSVFWLRSMINGTAIDIGFFANKPEVYTSDNYMLFMIRNGKFSTYQEGWDGTRNGLFNSPKGYGCKEGDILAYCAKLIEYDGWKISDDYPWGIASRGGKFIQAQ